MREAGCSGGFGLRREGESCTGDNGAQGSRARVGRGNARIDWDCRGGPKSFFLLSSFWAKNSGLVLEQLYKLWRVCPIRRFCSRRAYENKMAGEE